MGSVAGLVIDGAPFFLHEPVKDRFASPREIGTTTVRIEVFVDDPDGVIARAVEAGAMGSDIRTYPVPWGNSPPGRLHRPVRAPLAGRGQVSVERVPRIGRDS